MTTTPADPSTCLSLDAPCPCGSHAGYGECCAPLHRGKAAESVAALMRSRYSAFALRLEGYLRETWHPDHCPAELGLSEATHWRRLEVLDHGQREGQETGGEQGWVHFRATFQEHDRWQRLEEVSRFSRLDGRWVYVEGEARVTAVKPGRNEACPCGSGRKLKRCCAR